MIHCCYSVAQSCPPLRPHEPQHARLPCPSPLPEVYSNSCPFSRWCCPTTSSSAIPFSCLQSFPASVSFAVSQLITSDGQSIRASASASVLPMNIQGWFPLGLIGLISLQSKGLSRGFSSTTIQKHQFFSTQPSLQKKHSTFFTFVPALTPILDFWKIHNFDYTDLCGQCDVSAF